MTATPVAPPEHPTLVRLAPHRWIRDDVPERAGLHAYADPTAAQAIGNVTPRAWKPQRGR